MTIHLDYNYSVPFALYLNEIQPSLEYLLLCKNKFTGNETSTILDNISNVPNQYALFNLIAIESLPISGTSHNIITLYERGEYEYTLFNTLYVDPASIVTRGLIINKFTNSSDIVYIKPDNKKIQYGE